MFLTKRADNSYLPSWPSDWEASKKIKVGGEVKASKARNPMFLRKFMALVRLAYDNWNPPLEETKWGVPVKSFTRFRKDLTILAGHYELTMSIKGEPKVEALSLAFDSMDEETFEKVYNDVLTQVSIMLDTSQENIQSEVAGFY